LRRNDAAEGVAVGQDDAAMVYFGCGLAGKRDLGGFGAVDDGSATGRAPVGYD